MANLTQLRAGIAERLDRITDLEVHDTLVGNVNPPAVMVGGLAGDGLLEYDYTMGRGRDRWELTFWLYVAYADQDIAQTAMDPYLAHSGSLSIKATVEDTVTDPGDILNSQTDTVRLLTARDYGEYEVGGSSLLGVEFRLEVIAE